MPLKREMPEDAYGIVPQDPRDMVKATLLEAQSPVMQRHISRPQRLKNETFGRQWSLALHCYLPTEGTVRNHLTQGDGRDTYVALARLTSRKCGIAYGMRVLWRRSLHSSPRTGKPSTWRRQADVLDATRKVRHARCVTPKLP